MTRHSSIAVWKQALRRAASELCPSGRRYAQGWRFGQFREWGVTPRMRSRPGRGGRRGIVPRRGYGPDPSTELLATLFDLIRNGQAHQYRQIAVALPTGKGGGTFRVGLTEVARPANSSGFTSPLKFRVALYASFDAHRNGTLGLASANACRFGFYSERQGRRVARFATLDGLGLRRSTVAASDGRRYSTNDGLPESSRNRTGWIPSVQRGFRRPNCIGSY